MLLEDQILNITKYYQEKCLYKARKVDVIRTWLIPFLQTHYIFFYNSMEKLEKDIILKIFIGINTSVKFSHQKLENFWSFKFQKKTFFEFSSFKFSSFKLYFLY